MKKIIISAALILCSLPVFAQGLYFDIGLGFGKGWTTIGGEKPITGNPSELTMDMGLKLGYGPIGGIPLYIVGETGGMAHRYEGKEMYTGKNAHAQFNSYIFGPGVIYYPTPLIQLGVSVGFSWIANSTNLPFPASEYENFKSKSGYAYNIYAAVDLGESNHGCLLGMKYFYAKNKIEYHGESLGIDQKQSMLALFIKYAYRHKGE